MGNVTLEIATASDAIELVSELRYADYVEIRALGYEPMTAITGSVESSYLCWSARDSGLICLFGVSPISFLSGTGAPWMLGTDRLSSHAKDLMKICPPYIRLMMHTFPTLMNWVHSRNHTSIRWLKRLGFKVDPAEPYGMLGEMFHRFEMRI